ncbi:MAG: hypothetical protein HOL91_07355 [Actinobacteria bacterium]|nr:hypothetical protein [Actinomycetota bacterium]
MRITATSSRQSPEESGSARDKLDSDIEETLLLGCGLPVIGQRRAAALFNDPWVYSFVIHGAHCLPGNRTRTYTHNLVHRSAAHRFVYRFLGAHYR